MIYALCFATRLAGLVNLVMGRRGLGLGVWGQGYKKGGWGLGVWCSGNIGMMLQVVLIG